MDNDLELRGEGLKRGRLIGLRSSYRRGRSIQKVGREDRNKAQLYLDMMSSSHMACDWVFLPL